MVSAALRLPAPPAEVEPAVQAPVLVLHIHQPQPLAAGEIDLDELEQVVGGLERAFTPWGSGSAS